MKILVTGAAGFIGYYLSKVLLDRGDEVVGLDNLNDYYDISLKHGRLQQLEGREGFSFVRMDLADRDGMAGLFRALLAQDFLPKGACLAGLLGKYDRVIFVADGAGDMATAAESGVRSFEIRHGDEAASWREAAGVLRRFAEEP
mgnify:CR=1 FL=1